MTKAFVNTTTYHMSKSRNGWMLDIVESEKLFEAWLYHRNIGIKTYMFGNSRENMTFEEFVDLAVGNYEDYKADYKEDYYED